MLLERELYYGLGMDALGMGCSWTRTLSEFEHGCSGNRMLSDMNAIMVWMRRCGSRMLLDMNGIMVWTFMLARRPPAPSGREA